MDLSRFRAQSLDDRMLIEKAYGNRKNNCSGDIYNFDLKPLIENFSFYDFVTTSRRYNVINEHGGFLVITDKQYVLGYNSDFGKGTHTSSYARCYADFEGGKLINTYEDSLYYSSKCQSDFITARITFEKTGNNANGYPVFSGRIYFNFGKTPITQGKLDVLEQFYKDNAEEIHSICERYNIIIEYAVNDLIEKNCTLEAVMKYARFHMDPEAPCISKEDETIIGKTIKQAKTI